MVARVGKWSAVGLRDTLFFLGGFCSFSGSGTAKKNSQLVATGWVAMDTLRPKKPQAVVTQKKDETSPLLAPTVEATPSTPRDA